MKNFVYLYLIAIVGCTEPDGCKMRISNALPVQFWADGEETYNESSPNYIDDYCFHQKFKCSQDIRSRFADEKIKLLQLFGYDRDSVEVLSLPLTRTQVNNTLLDEQFESDFDGWDGASFSVTYKTEPWSWSGGMANSFLYQLAGDIRHTLALFKAYPLAVGKHFLNIYYELGDQAGTQQKITLQMYLINAGVIVRTINVDTYTGATSSYQKQVSNFPFTADIDYDMVAFGFIYNSNALSLTCSIGDFQIADLSDNYYDVNFVPSDYSLCGKSVQLKLKEKLGFGNWDTWQTKVGKPVWDLAPLPYISLASLDNSAFVTDYVNLPAGTYNYDYSITIDQLGIAVLNINFTKDGISVGTGTTGNLNGAATFTGTMAVTLTDVPDAVEISVANFSVATKQITVNSLVLNPTVYSNVAKSDFIELLTLVPDGTQIYYKANVEVADLPYIGNEEYFSIILQSRFFHEPPAGVQKVIELQSTDIISASELKSRKTLTMLDMPYYMHTKVQLILQHAVNGAVLINNRQQLAEDTYNILDRSSEWYPLRPSEVLLTEVNSTKRSVI